MAGGKKLYVIVNQNTGQAIKAFEDLYDARKEIKDIIEGRGFDLWEQLEYDRYKAWTSDGKRCVYYEIQEVHFAERVMV